MAKPGRRPEQPCLWRLTGHELHRATALGLRAPTRRYDVSREGCVLINNYDDITTELDHHNRDIAAQRIRALRKKLPVTVLAVIPLEEE